VRRRGRALAASLAVTAAALAIAVPRGGEGRAEASADAGEARTGPERSDRPEDPGDPAAPGGGGLVATAVRIADPGAVRLLKPGDEVDVLAAPPPGDGERPAPARVIAHRARVAEVPTHSSTSGPPGALLVLTVPPATAADLAGAAATGGLAVARW
jgi:hypothetical protein